MTGGNHPIICTRFSGFSLRHLQVESYVKRIIKQFNIRRNPLLQYSRSHFGKHDGKLQFTVNTYSRKGLGIIIQTVVTNTVETNLLVNMVIES